METKWGTQTRIFVISILLIVFVLFLYYIHDLLRQVVVAALLSFMLYPVATFLRRRTPLTQKTAGVIVFSTFLAILAVIPAIVTPIVIGEIDSLGSQLTDIIAGVNDFLSQTTILGYHIFSGVPQNLEDSLTGIFRPDQIYGSLAAITENVVWVGVILIMLYYLLVDWVKARNTLFVGIHDVGPRDSLRSGSRHPGPARCHHPGIGGCGFQSGALGRLFHFCGCSRVSRHVHQSKFFGIV
jgi:predicted PurR-regulated permease PerM